MNLFIALSVAAATGLFVSVSTPWTTEAFAATKICKNCVGNRQLKKNAVTGAKVKNGSLTGADIRNGSITAADLADAAKPPGAAAELDSGAVVGLTPTTLMDISIDAPAEGLLVVNSSGWGQNLVSGTAQCGLTSGTAIDGFGTYLNAVIGSIAMTRGFEVAAGTHTIKLICVGSAANSHQFGGLVMTAMFFHNDISHVTTTNGRSKKTARR